MFLRQRTSALTPQQKSQRVWLFYSASFSKIHRFRLGYVYVAIVIDLPAYAATQTSLYVAWMGFPLATALDLDVRRGEYSSGGRTWTARRCSPIHYRFQCMLSDDEPRWRK